MCIKSRSQQTPEIFRIQMTQNKNICIHYGAFEMKNLKRLFSKHIVLLFDASNFLCFERMKICFCLFIHLSCKGFNSSGKAGKIDKSIVILFYNCFNYFRAMSGIITELSLNYHRIMSPFFQKRMMKQNLLFMNAII